MIINRLPGVLVLGSVLAVAACGGEGLTLPPDGEAAHIVVFEGNEQSGRVGDPLLEPLVVRVTDTQDRPVANATVNFAFTDGAAGGAAVPATATTNSDGLAETILTLGSKVGQVTGTASVPVDPGITPVETQFIVIARPDDANGIAPVSGIDQNGPVGSELPNPLVVEVTDEFGNPISGVTVVWSLTGGGSVSAEETQTGPDGRTSVTRVLGPTAGQQTTVATAGNLAGSPVTFTHTATAGSAAGVNKFSGDEQSAQAGTQLANPLVVQVLDAQLNPIPNRPVTWVVGAGGGTVSPENTTTDAEGKASTTWTLGPAAGPNTVNAVVSGLDPATFTATGTAGTPSASNSTVTASPGTISTGGSSTITVTIRDATNNPVSGVSVSVSSTGTGNTITPPGASSTNASGVATFTFSSTVAETKTITATAGGVAITDGATITVQKVGSTVEITSDDPDPSTVNEQVTVEFTVTGSGGTPSGDVTVTLSGGSETCTGTLTNGSGSCNITPTAPGTGTSNRRVITATYSGDSRFNGDTDTENHRVDPATPTNNAPTARFTAPTNCTAGTPCQFTDESTDPDNDIVSWSWVFEDGGTSNQRNPAATFSSGGFKTVTLTVRDDDNASDDVSHEVLVNVAPPTNQAPVAGDDSYTTTAGTAFHAPGGGRESLLFNDTDPDFDELSTTAGTFATSAGGSVTIGVDGSFDYSPPAGVTNGTDTFTYTLDDGQGGTDTGAVTVTITPGGA